MLERFGCLQRSQASCLDVLVPYNRAKRVAQAFWFFATEPSRLYGRFVSQQWSQASCLRFLFLNNGSLQATERFLLKLENKSNHFYCFLQIFLAEDGRKIKYCDALQSNRYTEKRLHCNKFGKSNAQQVCGKCPCVFQIF